MTVLAAVDQQHTIDVLAELAARGLPRLGWHLSEVTVDRLDGQVGPGSDEEKRQSIAAWANFLGGEPVERRYEHHTSLSVTATYRGVLVRIYTHVAQCSAVVA